MINFALSCDQNHEFDGWFSSSSDFDNQLERGLITCPSCDSSSVVKSLMAPSVSTGRQKEQRALAMVDATRKDIKTELKALHKKLTHGAEDVGRRFPEEARKIHYGESEQRGIYGEANREEVTSLVEEGVEILPLPVLPEDTN